MPGKITFTGNLRTKKPSGASISLFVARARQLLVGGAFGADDIAAIRIPACASIEAQRADAHRAEYLEAQQYEAEHRPVLQEVDRYSEEVDLATGEGWTDELQGSQSKRTDVPSA